MSATLSEPIHNALAQFSSDTGLHELSVGEDSADLGAGTLLVGAFAAHDAVQGVGARDLIVVSTNARIALDQLLGQRASLEGSVADGTRTSFACEVQEVAMLGSDGGLARYRLRLGPWLWRLSPARNSRVWQDKSVIEIVESVFQEYGSAAIWRWSDETGPFMDEALNRNYCCQYCESDLAFVQRLLTEEGLAWRVEQTDLGPGVVLFADTSQLTAVPRSTLTKLASAAKFT